MYKRFVFFYLLIVFGSFEWVQAQRGGKLAYAETEAITEFNPYLRRVGTGHTDRLYSMVYETLIRYDYDQPEGERYVKMLAEDWIYQGDRTIRFKLRNGVSWHDGRPFTANDVVFSINFIKRRARLPWLKALFSSVSAQVIDAKTVEVKYAGPRSESDILSDFSLAWMIPSHLYKNLLPDPNAGTNLSKKAIGTGPYKMEWTVPNEGINLAANETYWGNKANILKVSVLVTPDRTLLAQQALLKVTGLVTEVQPKALTSLDNSGQFNLRSYPAYSFHAFGYNSKSPFLGNWKVRQALTRAVPRQEILDNVYLGRGELIAGPFVPASPYADAELQPLTYSPQRARRMLEEAGYRDQNGDGYAQDANGQRLSFRLLAQKSTEAGDTKTQNVVSSYVDALKKIGVEIKPIYKTFDDWEQQVFDREPNQRDFDIVFIRWSFDPSYDVTPLFDSKNNSKGGFNVINYNSPDIDHAIQEFQQTADPERRRQIMRAIQVVIQQESPYTFMYVIHNYAAYHIQYIGVKIDPYKFFTHLSQWKVLRDYLR